MWELYLGAILSWPVMIFWILIRRHYPRWNDGIRRALTVTVVFIAAVIFIMGIAAL